MTTSPVNGSSTETTDEESLASKTLMVGLPGTGKTSFLGLLFLTLVHNPEDNGPSINAFDEDRAYLNRIAGRLQSFEPASRTQVGDEGGLSLTINIPGSDQPMALVVPDLSGETWETAHVERVLAENIWDDVEAASGFMLFASVIGFEDAPTVEEGKQAARSLGLPADEWVEGEPFTERGGPSSTQVALVDLIQILSSLHDGPFNLSLILSAFDTVGVSATNPADWVEKNAPLLAQFLDGNASRVKAQIFGVSAQGGDYSDRSLIGELAEQPILERAYVLDAIGQRVGIHVPLLWALGDA